MFMLFLFFFLIYFVYAYAIWGVIWSVIYAWCFRRSNRPDYTLTPGEYCLEKMSEPPSRKEVFFKA